MAKPDFGCGREECGASTDIAGFVSFGTGNLDHCGFWENPCYKCELAWLKYEKEEKEKNEKSISQSRDP